MDKEIKVIDFDDILGTEEVASELGVTYAIARTLMNQQIIKSKRINGLITLKPLLEQYKKDKQKTGMN